MNELEKLKKLLSTDGINSKKLVLDRLNDLECLKALRQAMNEEINKGAKNG